MLIPSGPSELTADRYTRHCTKPYAYINSFSPYDQCEVDIITIPVSQRKNLWRPRSHSSVWLRTRCQPCGSADEAWRPSWCPLLTSTQQTDLSGPPVQGEQDLAPSPPNFSLWLEKQQGTPHSCPPMVFLKHTHTTKTAWNNVKPFKNPSLIIFTIRYSWTLNGTGLNCMGSLTQRFFDKNTIRYWPNVSVYCLRYDFLNNTVFCPAYFIVRIRERIHTTYKLRVNQWLMPPARLPVNRKLSSFRGVESYVWIFNSMRG